MYEVLRSVLSSHWRRKSDKSQRDSTSQCAKKSRENVLGSWHINTKKSSSAADYQFSPQPVRGGYMTQLQRYVYIYRPLRVIWHLSSKQKTRAQRAPIKALVHFSIIPIWRQGGLSVFMMAGWIPELLLIWSCFLEKMNHWLLHLQ